MKKFVYVALSALLLLFIARGVKNVEAKSTYNPDAFEIVMNYIKMGI